MNKTRITNGRARLSRAALLCLFLFTIHGSLFTSSASAQTPTPTATPTASTFIDAQKNPSRFKSYTPATGVNVPAVVVVDAYGTPASSGGGGDASAANQLALVAAPSLYRQPAQGVTKAQIKGAAGTLNGYSFVNSNTYPVYAKLYDALAASVTVGTTVPIRTIAIPSGGFIIQENAGIALTGFTTGITIAVTKLLDDTDATALDTAILAEVFYK